MVEGWKDWTVPACGGGSLRTDCREKGWGWFVVRLRPRQRTPIKEAPGPRVGRYIARENPGRRVTRWRTS